jgi:hypothetical protein
MNDRRSAQRFATRGAAKMYYSGSPFPRECLITDVSDGGVRLYVERNVPDEFTLAFRDGVRRPCRVAWRLGHEVGASFADATQPGFARRAVVG